MAETIPFQNKPRRTGPTEGGAASDGPQDEHSAHEFPSYTSEEVSEIFRVALRQIADGHGKTVSHEEMLSIGKDFGLRPSDILSAVDEMGRSHEEETRVVKAKAVFRLHLMSFLIVNAGLFFINWFTYPGLWWFQFPLVSWGMVVALHGVTVKHAPELPALALKTLIGLRKDLAYGRKRLHRRHGRATFRIEDVNWWGETSGLVQIHKDKLLFEHETKDTFFGVYRSRPKELAIPVEDIDSFDFDKKLFGARLVLRGRMLRSLRGLPGTKQGEVVLVFDRNARQSAEALAEELARQVDRDSL